MNNFVGALAPIAAMLGITPAEMAELEKDNEDLQSIAITTVLAESFIASLREYRISVTEGRIGLPQPVFPPITFGPPANNRPAGMFQRLIELVDRIRAAPAYSPEIGASLAIIPQISSNIAPEELKPVIKASESNSGYTFPLNITRMGMPQFKVQMRRTSDGPWEDVAFGTSSPIEISVTPTNPGHPERVLIRAVLMQKNKPVGQPSDMTYVTLNP
jgi:hypothetical protein